MSEQPVLEGRFIRLLPLQEEHTAHLAKIGLDKRLWQWNPSPVHDADGMARYVRRALDERDRGTALPWVMQWKASGAFAGCTRYGALAPEHRRLEIGWTWIAPEWQGTVVNPEAKWLMMDHAFTVRDCIRVELKTDARNSQSRAAMRAIGCTEEGTLRHHMITTDGHYRDTVYFSVLRAEWPRVSDILLERIARRQPETP